MLAAAGLAAAGCTGTVANREQGKARGAGGEPGLTVPGFRRIAALTPFDACDDFLAWVKGEARARVQPWGLPGVGGTAYAGMLGEDETLSPAMPTTMAASVPAGPAPAASAAAPEGSGAGAAAAPADGTTSAAPSFSGTNVQEAGVDEPDLVKTDGRQMVTVSAGRLRVIDVTGPEPREVGSVDLGTGAGEQLLLAGDRALVLSQDGGLVWTEQGTLGVAPGAPGSAPGAQRAGQVPGTAPGIGVLSARLTEVDLTDSAAPTITATLRVEGRYVDARLSGTTARIVLDSATSKLPFVAPTGPSSQERARQANLDVIEQSTAEQWLPGYVLEQGGEQQTGQAVACDRVHHAASFSGFSTVSVLTVDLARGLAPGDGAAVLGDGQRVYASAEHLYVAANRYPTAAPADAPATAPAAGPADTPAAAPAAAPAASAVPPTTVAAPADPSRPTGSQTEPASAVTGAPAPSAGTGGAPAPDPSPSGMSTVIHEFSIAGSAPATYLASGAVRGHLLDDFSLSEHGGVLRVATTDGGARPRGLGPDSESFVTVLRQDGADLVPVGQVGGLGHGEQIQAVRFVGDVGYVVTFRQTDPLYLVDLSDPAQPRVRGELELLGFSAYLHPVGDGRLLGIGQDAGDDGRRTGAQVALFDVSDLDHPRLVSKVALPQGWSQVEQDYHAFLWWAPARLAALPLQLYGEPGAEPFSGLVAYTVSDDQVTEKGRVTHPAPPVPAPTCPPSPAADGSAGSGTASSAETSVAPAPPPAVSPAVVPMICPAPTPYPAPITRSVVVGDTLYTLSAGGLKASSLADLSDRGFVPFS
jgi:hypothetical protein